VGGALARRPRLLRDSPEYRADLNRRLRLAYLAVAEEWSRMIRGRELTAEEVREALRDYPGDLPDLRDPHRHVTTTVRPSRTAGKELGRCSSDPPKSSNVGVKDPGRGGVHRGADGVVARIARGVVRFHRTDVAVTSLVLAQLHRDCGDPSQQGR
jgi:hypothetical protein